MKTKILKKKRPFRVLVVDDDIHAVKPLLTGGKHDANFSYYFLTALKEAHEGMPSAGKAEIELLWSQSADFSQKRLDQKAGAGLSTPNTFFRIFPKAAASNEELAEVDHEKGSAVSAVIISTGDSIEDFLKTIDVVILDLGKLHGTPPTVSSSAVLKNFEDARITFSGEIDALLKSCESLYEGVLFYHAYRPALSSCQLVAIFSGFDDKHDAQQEPVNKLLHPFCGLTDEERPFTVKYGKSQVQSEGKHSSLHTRIVSMYVDYCEGYTQLRHLGQIEQAANHDFPVMIVGESGTGKEYVARAIHRRWVAEKQRRKPDIKDNFVVVNCAGLSSELARSELFGHVAGSFTGATDHRIGAILKACGCRGFKRTTTGETQKFQEAKKQAGELADAIINVLNEQDDKKKYGYFKSHVLPSLNAAVSPEQNALVSVLRAVQKKLENAAHGDDLVQDYYTGLTETNAANAANLEKLKTGDGDEYLGVKFKHEHPIGTLFLDEFGDLPLEVQNLLLRFLEEKSGEIQPVGYPGRIAGIKIRLILATSDPRIAKFAGYDLLGAHRSRSDEEMERSLRHDLLFRVKGQVIRTEAIKTQEQVWASLDEMIVRHSNPQWTWIDEAKEYLAGPNGEITKILTALVKSNDKTNDSRFMVFGQRRELKRIIDLANAYMESAERRGLRLESNEITKKIIQEIWRPSELLMTKPTLSPQAGNADVSSSHNPSSDELTTEGIEVRAKILAILDGQENLLSAEVFRKYVQALDDAPKKALNKTIANAVGLDKAGKNQKAEKYKIIGQIFRYGGKSNTQPSNSKDYGKQTGEWWRTQVFKPKK